MNENEYKAQKAMGTIDYRQAAVEAVSAKVLASIVEDTQDRDAHAAVAMNSKTDVRTLTRIIIERGMPDHILDACVWHPSVTRKILEAWMQRDYMQALLSARSRLHSFQASEGVPTKKRISFIDQMPQEVLDQLEMLKKTGQVQPRPHPHPMWPQKFIGDPWTTYKGTFTSNSAVDSTPPELGHVSTTSSYLGPASTSVNYTMDSADVDEQIAQMLSQDKEIRFDSLKAE